MCLWDVRLRRPQRIKQHQRIKKLPPKQAPLKRQLKPLLKPPQMRQHKHLLMLQQKPRSKLQLNQPPWSKPQHQSKRWWRCAAMTARARRKPSPHLLGGLVTNPEPVAMMGRLGVEAQTLPDRAEALMRRAAAMRLNRVARAWVTPLSALNAMPLSKPTTPCAVWPCKPTAKPWCT